MKYLLEYDDATNSLLISDLEEKLGFVITAPRIRSGFNPRDIKDCLDTIEKATQNDLR